MKQFFLKPGFELIFSLSLIVILALPPVLMAQTKKDLEIKIENGDTTINGKNIKDLSADDRRDALKDIRHLNNPASINGVDGMQHRLFYKRKDTLAGRENYVEFKKKRPAINGHMPMITEDITVKDSMGNIVETRTGRRREMARDFTFKYRNDGDRPMPPAMDPAERGFGRYNGAMMRFERKNTENFSYVNTDAQGIMTHINFHISEPIHEDLQKISGIEGSKLEISDLSIVPEFTSGKTVLMFSLPSKAVAEVNLKNGEGKLIWSDKLTGGSFSKSFNLPLNGVYYLHIKQGNGMAVKKIIKEE